MAIRRLAAVDIGSNAMRLRVAELDSRTSEWTELASERAAVRLGKDVFDRGTLSRASVDRACDALRSFRDVMDELEVSSYRAVATSATREAANGHVFVARARREAGIDIETIDGLEEARLVQLAVSRAVSLTGRTALVDIGGGSTEVTVLDRRATILRSSLPLGTVRLLSAWHPEGGRVSRKRLAILQEVVARQLAEVGPELASAKRMVATGGAVRAIAKVCGRDTEVSAARLASLIDRLRTMHEGERMEAYDLRADRADTILPAAVVLASVAEAAGASSFVTPMVGVRDGILAELGAACPKQPRPLPVRLVA